MVRSGLAQVLTREEAMLCQRALQKRGYTLFYLFGNDLSGFTLRARKWPPYSPQGLTEQSVTIRRPEDLAALLD